MWGLGGKNISGRGNGQCKGPEVGACLVWVRTSQEASAVGEGVREIAIGDELTGVCGVEDNIGPRGLSGRWQP